MSLKIIDEDKTGPNKYYGQDSLAPAKVWYVLFTLAVALTLNFMPLQGLALNIRPDFAALTIIFWSINQPQRLGMTIVFCIGLMMDVHHTGLLGHHAFAYCTIAYIAYFFRRRLGIFNLAQQAPQIGIILLIMQVLLALIALLGSSAFTDWHFFLSVLSGAILWPMISFVLSYPLKVKSGSDTR